MTKPNKTVANWRAKNPRVISEEEQQERFDRRRDSNEALFALMDAVRDGQVDPDAAGRITKVITASIGTTVYVVPIRFWEDKEPYEAVIVEKAYKTDYRYVMAKPTDDHQQYLSTDKLFLTKEEAREEIDRRIAKKKEKEDAEVDLIMKKIFENKKKASSN